MTASSVPAKSGEYWGYRRRDSSPSERVLVESIESTKTKVRALVNFDDGRQESIPGARLKVPWAEVEQYDQQMISWEKIREEQIDKVESHCVWLVFDLLVPAEIAEIGWRPVENTTDIADIDTFSKMLGTDVRDYAEEFASLKIGSSLYLSPHATVAIAERLCRINPAVILDKVMEDERTARHKCKHGSQHEAIFKDDDGWRSPEWEYTIYLEYDRPRHELLRQWCGHRAVTVHERLKAAEAESHRLEVQLEHAYKLLEKHVQDGLIQSLRRENEKERITPYNVRATPDRPLDPSEIPVRVEYRRRGRWW